MKAQHIVIIKTGFFETFAEDSGSVVSLGDILRTTVLLPELLAHSNVHWITSASGFPLIQEREGLFLTAFESEPHFENIFREASLIINLERHPVTSTPLRQYQNKVVGFVPNELGWQLKNIRGEVKSLQAWNLHFEEQGYWTWNSRLLNLLGMESRSLVPIYKKPEVRLEGDVGLNWKPGKKWPSKNLGQENWQNLETQLSPHYKVSWQKGFDSISEYASWIASNRVLVTIDSLGLHLAVAMGIPVVALFGPTNSRFIDKTGRDSFLSLTQLRSNQCGPCYLEYCNQPSHCANDFPFKKIKTEIDRLIGSSNRTESLSEL